MLSMALISNKDVWANYDGHTLPNDNDVYIAEMGVIMPLGRILLIKKGDDYCALKFTKFWIENTSEVGTFFVSSGSDKFGTYEAYFQADKTGNFGKNNVQVKKDKLSFPKPRGLGRLAFSFGNKEVSCGTIELEWFGKSGVYFYGEGQKENDYGIEFAPTKWADISEVNVFDTRLTWYRYDINRKRVNIPIDGIMRAE